jgi:hypothetical protein
MTLLKVNPNGFLVILVSHVIEKRPYHVTQTQNEKKKTCGKSTTLLTAYNNVEL